MAFSIDQPNAALGGYCIQAAFKTAPSFVSKTVQAVAADLAATNAKIQLLAQGHGGAYMNDAHEAVLNANSRCRLPDGADYCDQLVWRCRDLGLRLFPLQKAIAEDAGAYCISQVIKGTAMNAQQFEERGEFKEALKQFNQMTTDIESGKVNDFGMQLDAMALAVKEKTYLTNRKDEEEKKIAAIEQKLAERSYEGPLDQAIELLNGLVLVKPGDKSLRDRVVKVFQWHKEGGERPTMDEFDAFNQKELFGLYKLFNMLPAGEQVWQTIKDFNKYYNLTQKYFADHEYYLQFLKNRSECITMLKKSKDKIEYLEKLIAVPMGDWMVGKEQLKQAAYLCTFKKLFYQKTVEEMQAMDNQLNAIANAGYQAKVDPMTFEVVADPNLPPNSMSEAELEKARRAHLLYLCQLTATHIYPVNFEEQKNVEAYLIYIATGTTKLEFIERGDVIKARSAFFHLLENIENPADHVPKVAPLQMQQPQAIQMGQKGKPAVKLSRFQKCRAGLRKFFAAIGRALRWFFTKIAGKHNTATV